MNSATASTNSRAQWGSVSSGNSGRAYSPNGANGQGLSIDVIEEPVVSDHRPLYFDLSFGGR